MFVIVTAMGNRGRGSSWCFKLSWAEPEKSTRIKEVESLLRICQAITVLTANPETTFYDR
jgi:hypothetical protein